MAITAAGAVRFAVFSAVLLSALYGITIATGLHPRVPLTALIIVSFPRARTCPVL
jgi:hypothetical protein